MPSAFPTLKEHQTRHCVDKSFFTLHLFSTKMYHKNLTVCLNVFLMKWWRKINWFDEWHLISRKSLIVYSQKKKIDHLEVFNNVTKKCTLFTLCICSRGRTKLICFPSTPINDTTLNVAMGFWFEFDKANKAVGSTDTSHPCCKNGQKNLKNRMDGTNGEKGGDQIKKERWLNQNEDVWSLSDICLFVLNLCTWIYKKRSFALCLNLKVALSLPNERRGPRSEQVDEIIFNSAGLIGSDLEDWNQLVYHLLFCSSHKEFQ